MIPLKNALNSGDWAWDREKRPSPTRCRMHHLIAVTASANRKKGAPEDLRNGSPPTEDTGVITLSIGCR